ncbi:hypothetical protein Slin14017_G128780 [Septoria linicola]|nr:hypothetical protein Slin14017_G128780 [Septoria linicola]
MVNLLTSQTLNGKLLGQKKAEWLQLPVTKRTLHIREPCGALQIFATTMWLVAISSFRVARSAGNIGYQRKTRHRVYAVSEHKVCTTKDVIFIETDFKGKINGLSEDMSRDPSGAERSRSTTTSY